MSTLRILTFLALVLVARGQPLVITTNTILDDLVRRVAGDAVRVQCLLPPGADPHAYEPRPTDIRTIARANLVVANGLGFELWLNKLVLNSGFRGRLVTAATGVPHLDNQGALHDHPDAPDTHNHGPVDPHAWHDVRNVIRYLENIRAALVAVAPAQAAAIDARAAAYTSELRALHAYATERFATIPVERRKLVTSHDALRYLGHAYGLTVVPVSGLSPDQEPNAKQLAALIRFIRDQHVPAVFVETTTNPKLVALLADEAGVKTPAELYTDSLGAPGTPEATFIGMVRHNVDTIVAALR